MNRHEKALRRRLRDDYQFYAERNLKIRVKTVGENKEKIQPFVFNKAQLHIHKQISEQKERTGKVRAMLLKGRQQGGSTYVGGRYYHQTTHREGFKTFILSHRDDATSNLFAMVKRFHEHCNPTLKASTSNSSKREIVFNKLDSSYALGTAGSGSVGRSDTIDLLHGSECAFWKNTDEIKTGIMQAANEASEIILESTANGFDTFFYPMWQKAQAGESEYIAIFVPWFWQPEYQINVDDSFNMTEEEAIILGLYIDEGMTVNNIAWRRNKLNAEFENDETLFKQEYPCTAHEAFQVTGIESFIKPEVVIRARKAKDVPQIGAHIVGIDPARGGDRTAFMHRQGRVMWKGPIIKTPDTKVISGRIRELFDGKDAVDWVFIDIGGLGGPIYDTIKDTDYGEFCIPVNFGSKHDVVNKQRYVNKRAEMIGEFKKWLENDTMPVSIPDDDDIQADICAPSWTYDNEQRILIESKKSMSSRGLVSTDLLDSGALTFAKPMAKRVNNVGVDNQVSVLL